MKLSNLWKVLFKRKKSKMSKVNKEKSSNKFTDDWRRSNISRTIPSYRNHPFITTESWLEGKHIDDEAEGLWRIYDTLYDFTPFISKHPGGSFWLEKTKGTDITEPFETHHIKGISPLLLQKYKIREALKPRNYTFTMHEKGFYKTLKSRVAETLKDLDYTPVEKSNLFHLTLLISTLVCSILSALNAGVIFELIAALSLCWLSTSAHNYFHQKDNWQMYTFNFTLMNFAEWRISHAISHHVYTNSLYDLEMSLFEPFLCWIPNEHISSKVKRILSVIIQPIFYVAIFPFHFIQRLLRSVFVKNELLWHDVIGFSLPLLMLICSNSSLTNVLLHWSRIIAIGSFLFGLIGLNAAHHTPTIYHDGDANRKDRDWGLYQLDTVIDRGDIKGSQFMVLTHFGEHALHHLFPTLDHGVLPQLYPVFRKTLEEFKEELRECTFLEHIIGQNKQLLRTKPNPVPPCERNKKSN
ncbi:cytochrome b5-related protein [Lucilia sericata]|uniref:cytochrome b5-related protein n=1 Tax=Lucilia sericata TaxID=13632 RepID=UPI0018A85C50|nr:cytochrome b5-related protein [Lucilia sericata]